MTSSATVEEYVELLNAEQHVDLQKLRDYARHGVQPEVRGEVWLYLLGVLSDDKGQEMTSVRSKYLAYEAIGKHNPALEKRIRSECSRYYQKRLGVRPPPGRSLIRSSRSVPDRRPGGMSTHRSGARDYASDVISAPMMSTTGSIGSSTALAAATSSSTMAAATAALLGADRGPNRVNDGRIHALGGIIGESGVTAAMDADDPEAAAAQELKRFGKSVENIICAFMSRCTAAEQAHRKLLQETTMASDEPYALGVASHSNNGSAINTSRQQQQQQHGGGRGRMGTIGPSSYRQQDEEAADNPFRVTSPNAHHDRSGGNAPRSGSIPSSKPNGGNPGGTISIEDSLRARMPREYEWMPQLAPSTPQGSVADFHPALVYLCAPFVQCVRVEAGMYFAFERLMSLMAEHSARHPLPLQVATFLTLFRTTLPELHSYFEEEEVDIIGFATNWLQHLLAGELRIEDLMRLWDTYFAMSDFLDLHLYVCIAILTNCKDSLEELDRSETKSMLYSLPPLDIDRIINEAINIRLSHQQSQRNDES
ncbi:hypothetical protein BCV70DRAFT_185391 [Testicularia cyperi]|uniref:Rab-GAP TBC domain-containing protein n=1 Tax=Testicularia cyperi TaxID=1882483 RepID=A0A317XU21_9BASI|nr:hypothetical protein BCV70DRAFT_185391 [Testicularia cyperi]